MVIGYDWVGGSAEGRCRVPESPGRADRLFAGPRAPDREGRGRPRPYPPGAEHEGLRGSGHPGERWAALAAEAEPPHPDGPGNDGGRNRFAGTVRASLAAAQPG